MVRAIFKVLAADIVLLVALFYVLQDLQWRSNFAASLHRACPLSCGYSPSSSYSLLTRFFTMSGNGVSLTSPATLDWVQVIALLLAVINVWFIYATLAKQRASKTSPAAQP
jgi:hypothetical protein